MSKSALSGFFFVVLVVFIPMSASAATADDIDRLDQQWAQAIINGDMKAFDALNANEFFYNRRGGDSFSKADYIAFLTSGDIKVKKAAREEVLDPGLRRHGRGYRNSARGRECQGGRQESLDIRYMHVSV